MAQAATVESRPQRADARRNHERIVEAARAAFGERGAVVQMDEVARRAGVGVGTVYRHFPTKEALVAEVARHVVAGCVVTADDALALADPWEAMETVVRANAAAMARDVGLRDTLTNVRFDGACPFEGSELQSRHDELIGRAQRAGALRADVTAADFQSLMCGLSASIAHGGDARRHADILLAGLRAG